MENTRNITNLNAGTKQDFIDTQTRAIEEASVLMMTERIFAGIERVQLHIVPATHDLSPLKIALQDMKNGLALDHLEMLNNAECGISQELQYWRLSLAERDLRVGTFDLRQFCEKTGNALDFQVLAVLARFYRNLPSTNIAQSKYDYVVTKMFTREENKGKRELRIGREELLQNLNELTLEWAEVATLRQMRNEQKITAAVTILNSFVAEAHEKQTIEDFARLEIFSRIRKFKMRLGEMFYAPEVTAASVFCNVEVGNKFAELLAKENENLRDSTTFRIGLVESLQDFASDQSSRTKQILTQVAAEETANPTNDETPQTGFNLLEIATPTYPAGGRADRERKANVVEKMPPENLPPAKDETSYLANVITQEEEWAEIVSDETHRTASGISVEKNETEISPAFVADDAENSVETIAETSGETFNEPQMPAFLAVQETSAPAIEESPVFNLSEPRPFTEEPPMPFLVASEELEMPAFTEFEDKSEQPEIAALFSLAPTGETVEAPDFFLTGSSLESSPEVQETLLLQSEAGENTAESPATETVENYTEEKVLAAETSENVAESVENATLPESAPDFLKAAIAELRRFGTNAEIVARYLANSPTFEIQTLDLEIFLPAETNNSLSAELALHRETLALILQADGFLNQTFTVYKVLAEAENVEMAALLEKMQTHGVTLRQTTREINGEDKELRIHALLYTANQLLEARLRLNSAFARRNAMERAAQIAAAQVVTNAEKIHVTVAPDKTFKTVSTPTKSSIFSKLAATVNVWLLGATITVAIGSFGVYQFANAQENETKKVNRNVVAVDPKLMLGGGLIMSAKITNETLFGFVTSEWENASEKDREESLKKLLTSGTQRKFKDVLLVDQTGKIVGQASSEGINISGN